MTASEAEGGKGGKRKKTKRKWFFFFFICVQFSSLLSTCGSAVLLAQYTHASAALCEVCLCCPEPAPTHVTASLCILPHIGAFYVPAMKNNVRSKKYFQDFKLAFPMCPLAAPMHHLKSWTMALRGHQSTIDNKQCLWNGSWVQSWEHSIIPPPH